MRLNSHTEAENICVYKRSGKYRKEVENMFNVLRLMMEKFPVENQIALNK